MALCALPCLTIFFCTRPLALVLLWLAVLFYEEITLDAFAIFPAIGQLKSIYWLPVDIPYFFTFIYLTITAATRPRRNKKGCQRLPILTLFIFTVIASVVNIYA